jgi:hypothetical protein
MTRYFFLQICSCNATTQKYAWRENYWKFLRTGILEEKIRLQGWKPGSVSFAARQMSCTQSHSLNLFWDFPHQSQSILQPIQKYKLCCYFAAHQRNRTLKTPHHKLERTLDNPEAIPGRALAGPFLGPKIRLSNNGPKSISKHSSL